jgi:hypothetical protein
MKKSFVITCLAIVALSLMAIGYTKEPSKEKEKNKLDNSLTIEDKEAEKQLVDAKIFAIEVGSRYLATVSKEKLNQATSIIDILPKDAKWEGYSIHKTHVSLIDGDLVTKAIGNSLILNDQQLALLEMADYTNNIRFIAEHPGIAVKYGSNYFLTVVPEKEVEYANGKDDLLSYLRMNSAAIIAQVADKEVGAGKIAFTIDVLGNISNVNLTDTSGHLFIDLHMVNLLTTIPGKWIPAKNAQGERVAQRLVFSFGIMGC